MFNEAVIVRADFPPAPKLDVYGKLDPRKATPAELRGQALFFGKGQCAACHVPPYYTDNLMHNLRAERFYMPQTINGMMASADGPLLARRPALDPR